MVKLSISDSYLTIASYQEFLVFSLEPNTHFWTFRVNINCAENVPKSEGCIECLAFSSCGKYFVVYFDKNILIYSTFDWKTICICPGERKASSVQFFPSSKIILLADKSGCASFYAFENKELQKLDLALGHNSMLTSSLVTEDEKFVITGDRDEKIRITKYPNVYNIEKYCLGHKMFITCLGFLPVDKRILVSSSGDGTIRFWNFISGKQLALYNHGSENEEHESSKVITKFTSCEMNQMSVFAILEYKSNKIKIINVKGDLNTSLEISLIETLMLNSIPWDIGFQNKTLVCLLPDQSNPVALWSPELSEPKKYENVSLYLIQNWDPFLEKSKKNLDDIPVLFKREIDNLQEYEQRKRARLMKTGKTS